MVDIKSKNVGYAGNVNQNLGRHNRNSVAIARNGMVQQMEANDQNIQRVLRTESNPGKTNVQCYNCNARELNEAVIMMARIQPTDNTNATSLRSDADILSEVNALTKRNKSQMPSKGVYEYKNHVKLKTVINTFDDDQIDSSIIFDDPYVKDNEHDSITHDQYVDLRSLMDNVQHEAQNEHILEAKNVKIIFTNKRGKFNRKTTIETKDKSRDNDFSFYNMKKEGVSATRHGPLRRTRHGAVGRRKHWPLRRRKHRPFEKRRQGTNRIRHGKTGRRRHGTCLQLYANPATHYYINPGIPDIEQSLANFTFLLLLQTLKVYNEEEDTIGVCCVDCGIFLHLWLLQDPTIKAKKLLELP
uniref:Uncharacterized protein n=1 Tax=Tanacetum cinerariifolium TaxID=118510 RepID=A0A699GPQ1_TANCI|nr:hypothetical protein [Tanacetum cinerariifolium]